MYKYNLFTCFQYRRKYTLTAFALCLAALCYFVANFKGYPLCIPYRLLYRFSPSLAFQAVCFWLLVDGCYFLCSTLRKKKDKERTRGKCLFYTV